MLDILISTLDFKLWCAKNYSSSYTSRKTFYDQAFEMLKVCMMMLPDSSSHLETLWEETYRPQFENLLRNEYTSDD